ncbi:MAG: hypothetical protein KIT58_00790 [Planctomycetota bacterium]|nr:hypothetical protein [Planctomycetota bacterium]
MLRTASLALALVGLVAPTALAQTAERAGLGLQLKAGDELRYKLTWSLDQKMNLGGQEMPQALEVECALDQRVKAFDNGVATIEATITAVRARLGLGPFGDMDYDTAAPQDEANPFAWIREAIGKSFQFKLKTTGEVLEVTGGDAIRDRMTAVLEEKAARQQGGGGGGMGGMGMGMGMDPGMLTAQAVVVFADESMKSALGVLNHVLPDAGAAKEGDAWERPIVEKIPSLGTLSFTSRITHRGGAGSAVRLAWQASDEVQLRRDQGGRSDDPREQMAREMQRQLTDKLEVKRKAVSGTVSFDAAAGRIIDSEATHRIDMEGPLPPMLAGMMGPEGKNAKMKQDVVLTLRYVRVDGAAPPQGGGRF